MTSLHGKLTTIVLKQLEGGGCAEKAKTEDANTIKLYFCVNEVLQHQYSLFLFVYNTYIEIQNDTCEG